MRHDGAIILEVEKFAVRHFDYALADNVVVGSGAQLGHFRLSVWRAIQNTKLQLLDDLRSMINDLGLAQIHLGTIRRLHDYGI